MEETAAPQLSGLQRETEVNVDLQEPGSQVQPKPPPTSTQDPRTPSILHQDFNVVIHLIIMIMEKETQGKDRLPTIPLRLSGQEAESRCAAPPSLL